MPLANMMHHAGAGACTTGSRHYVSRACTGVPWCVSYASSLTQWRCSPRGAHKGMPAGGPLTGSQHMCWQSPGHLQCPSCCSGEESMQAFVISATQLAIRALPTDICHCLQWHRPRLQMPWYWQQCSRAHPPACLITPVLTLPLCRLWKSYVWASGAYSALRGGGSGLRAGLSLGRHLVEEQAGLLAHCLASMTALLGSPYAELLWCQVGGGCAAGVVCA